MANIRRDRGDGSIRRRPNGSWEGRYSYVNDDGKRITKSVYAQTQSEVKRKLKDLIQNIEIIEKEQLISPNDILVGEWLDTWMQEYKKNSIRPATYTSYHHSIEKHIRPAIDSIELQKLRPEHIQKLLNEMGKPHGEEPALAPWTILKAKNIISGALEQAVRNHILIINPAKATIPPKLEQKDIRILTEAEQQKFMDACKGHRLEPLYLLALATGMRRGEILALTWDCVDLKSQNITVKGSVSRIKDPDTGITELKFSEPKTKSGRRQVPILNNMLPILQAHKVMQDEEKAEAGSAWNPRNLVFCSNVGTTIEPRRVCTTLDKIAEKAKLPHITFHSLRHTFATRMLEAEVPAKVVQDVLGHADVTLTLNTYSHVIGSTAHEQMSKINGLFMNKPANPPSILKQLDEAKKQIQENKNSAKKKSKGTPEL